MASQTNQSSRLYVGGLNMSVQQKDVEELFSKHGNILEIRMNRNFAFVQFSEDSEAQSAIKDLNGTQHFGRRLDVQVARHPKQGGGKDDPPSSRDRSPIGGGRGGRESGGGGGGGGRGGMGGGGRGGYRGSGERGGGMYNNERGGGGRGGYDGEPGFGGRPSGDFRGDRGGPDFRDRGDFPSRNEPSFRSSEPPYGSGREFSLVPPTGFRENSAKGKFGWGGGGGGSGVGSGGGGVGGGGGLNEKAFEPRMRDGPPMSYNNERPPTHPIEPVSISNNERTNDIEIIIVDKSLTEYGEMIERRMSSLGFSVDVLFPHEAVPLARVLANIASRGTLYAVVINHVHQINGSLTLHILHGRPQEHRNMALEDAVTLLLRNYETYTRQCREKGGPNSLPEQVRHLLTQVLSGRQLTATQYDILVQFLIQEKLKLEPQSNPAVDNQTTNAQQAELQTRILSILNKSSVGTGAANMEPPVQPQAPSAVIQPHGPLLQDPSIQKALDSLIQGGDLLRKIAPQQPAPFGRF